MNNDNNQNTISSNQQLMKYPSELIKKGLNLANKIQSPDLAKAETFLRLAIERVQEGDYQGALIGFEQALKINPNYYEVYILRSFLIYTPLGNYAAVINDYNQVLRLNPKNAEAYTNRGYAHASLGNHLEALRDYERALKLDPHCIQTYINCGLSHIALQNYEKAIVYFTQALQINPQNADAYNNRGLSYCYLGNYKIALANFNQDLKFAPNHIKAYLNRGYTESYNKIISINPYISEVYRARSLSYSALGYLAEAMADLQRAMSID